ncbi:MAG: NADH-quinone oxidoreductase subunit K [Candidatus Omnitrophica bacterium]|nr:NADH-quinone oxidoreductase subunit K [Candidatus Omnitrophota bacterium]
MAAVMLLVTGFYCVLATYNLVRVLIGLEILIKAVTLLIILAGYLTGKAALTQTLVITLIVVEVVVMTVGMGVILGAYRHYGTLDARELRKLKG